MAEVGIVMGSDSDLVEKLKDYKESLKDGVMEKKEKIEKIGY